MTELSSNIEEPSELGKEHDGIINIRDESLSKSDIMPRIQLISQEDIFRNIYRCSLLPHYNKLLSESITLTKFGSYFNI